MLFMFYVYLQMCPTLLRTLKRPPSRVAKQFCDSTKLVQQEQFDS